jgi:hypothetical protein
MHYVVADATIIKTGNAKGRVNRTRNSITSQISQTNLVSVTSLAFRTMLFAIKVAVDIVFL